MEVIVFLVIVSTSLAAGAVLFFVWLVRQRSHEHTDRMSFLPLEESRPVPPETRHEN